jgi:hypothetical protein
MGKSKSTKVVQSDVAQTEVAVVSAKTLRLPLPQALVHNGQFVPVVGTPTAAGIAFTAKGTNPKKARVYGYDNLGGGGGIPKDKYVVLVAGTTGVPKGVNAAQWDTLVDICSKDDPITAATAIASVTGRTLRRSYRAGYIRFAI